MHPIKQKASSQVAILHSSRKAAKQTNKGNNTVKYGKMQTIKHERKRTNKQAATMHTTKKASKPIVRVLETKEGRKQESKGRNSSK